MVDVIVFHFCSFLVLLLLAANAVVVDVRLHAMVDRESLGTDVDALCEQFYGSGSGVLGIQLPRRGQCGDAGYDRYGGYDFAGGVQYLYRADNDGDVWLFLFAWEDIDKRKR